MRLKSFFLSFILITSGLTVNIQANNQNNTHIVTITDDGFILHTVQKGETAYSIAVTYSTSVEEIYKLNPSAIKGIKEGQTLKIPKLKSKISDYQKHEIKSKETLYGISKQYGVSVEEILASNAGLTESTFHTGRIINIPLYEITTTPTTPTTSLKDQNLSNNTFIQHKVEKGETLYSISKQYNISLDALFANNRNLSDGLKKDMILYIPRDNNIGNNGQYYQDHSQPSNESDYNSNPIYQQQNSVVPFFSKEGMIRIGIILPFLDKNGTIQNDKLIEYYNGFLLAVKDMKAKGVSAEIYTFDSGTEKDLSRLKSVLGTTEAANLSLIIGGISPQQINTLSRFSAERGIKYVVPFGTKNKDAAINRNTFQLTTSHSWLYPLVTKTFINNYHNTNIIFVSENSNRDKKDFTTELKKRLSEAGITYKIASGGANIAENIKLQISKSQKNILISESSSESSLRQLISAAQASSESTIELFGYPEWQTYTQLYNELYKHNSCIFTTFFLDESHWKVQSVNNDYKKWYGKTIINSYPKYALLGYDAGIYFLTALSKYGKYFESDIFAISAPTLQSAIDFEPDNTQGGYINTGIYFVRFKQNLTIEKTEYNK